MEGDRLRKRQGRKGCALRGARDPVLLSPLDVNTEVNFLEFQVLFNPQNSLLK